MEVTDINKISEVIYQADEVMNDHIDSIHNLLSNDVLKNICKSYEENKSKRIEEGYNIFKIISDTYYRENFHSDILASLLQKEQKHNAGDKYLKEFVKLLSNSKPEINVNDFLDSVVTREKGRIDILIIDKSSSKVIIVENKIYNAIDMERQLPRYKDYIDVEKDETGNKLKVVAIVYLSINGNKRPDFNGWSKNDIDLVNPLLIPLAAYGESENNLFNGWLKPCIHITTDIDALCILRQYSKLIQNLGKNIMNKKLFKDFYNNVLTKNDNYNTALSIKSMVDELPQYLTQRIVDDYENNPEPFTRVFSDYGYAIFHWKIMKLNLDFKLHILCDVHKYKIIINDQDSNDVIKGFFKENGFKEEDNSLTKEIIISNLLDGEKQLHHFIDDFKISVGSVINELFQKHHGLIEIFQRQISEVAKELSLQHEFLPKDKEFGEAKSGFFFHKKIEWQYCRIGFEFEDNGFKDFFGGICSRYWGKPIDISLSEKIAAKFERKEKDPNQYWPYWFWFNEHKNWDEKTFEEIKNGELKKNIKTKVKDMLEIPVKLTTILRFKLTTPS